MASFCVFLIKKATPRPSGIYALKPYGESSMSNQLYQRQAVDGLTSGNHESVHEVVSRTNHRYQDRIPRHTPPMNGPGPHFVCYSSTTYNSFSGPTCSKAVVRHPSLLGPSPWSESVVREFANLMREPASACCLALSTPLCTTALYPPPPLTRRVVYYLRAPSSGLEV